MLKSIYTVRTVPGYSLGLKPINMQRLVRRTLELYILRGALIDDPWGFVERGAAVYSVEYRLPALAALQRKQPRQLRGRRRSSPRSRDCPVLYLQLSMTSVVKLTQSHVLNTSSLVSSILDLLYTSMSTPNMCSSACRHGS